MEFLEQHKQSTPPDQKKRAMAAAPDNASASALKRLYVKLWPLSPLLLFYLIGLLLFTAFRGILCISNLDRIREVPNYLRIFSIGLKLDTVLLCYVLVIPAFILLASPLRLQKIARLVTAIYFACMAGIFYYLEVATFPFMAEFDNRPDRVFLEHMTQIREVGEMILKGYMGTLVIALSGMALIIGAIFFGFNKLPIGGMRPVLSKRIGMFFVAALLLIMGIRFTIVGRPASMSIATFSTSHLVNQLGFNSTYSLGYNYFQLKRYPEDPNAVYGSMPKDEVFQRVMASNGLSLQGWTDPEVPFMHLQKSGFEVQRSMNLVIILEESINAEYVGHLGGLPLTPNMDRLSREGLMLKNFYCTGIRTLRGIEAIMLGFLPTWGESPLKSATGQEIYYTIARALKNKGYSTAFLYGGKSTFDNMRACFIRNGVEYIYDQSYFKNPVFTGTWGVSDEDLFAKANQVFRNHGEKPFFALVLTTSNHDPYEFPDGRIDLYKEPKASRENTIKYADYALGKFFEMAKKEPYYKNTVFLIIADHGTRLQGQSLIPIQKFHIPGIIIAPHLKPAVYEKLASQIDMTPTLLDIMGISTELPLIGRPLLSIPPGMPGRAVMQYSDMHAFMVDSTIIIQQPDEKPQQFTVSGDQLTPCGLDPELAKDALAYALLPDFLASKKHNKKPRDSSSLRH